MFQKTQKIIEKTEGYLLDLPTDRSLWKFITRFAVFPFKYLYLGIKELFKPVSLWAFSVFILLIIGTFLMEAAKIDTEYYLFILNFCIYVPMALVIFAVPSTYCYYGVNNKHVQEIVEFLKQESFNTVDEIELFEENIEKIYSRILLRISFYKWFIGIIWAIYIFFANIEIRMMSKAQVTGWENELFEKIFSWGMFLTFTIIVFTLIVSYKRASEILIKSIEFSCVEYKYRLLKNT